MLSDHIASTNIARRYVLKVEKKKKKAVETRERLEYLVTLNSKKHSHLLLYSYCHSLGILNALIPVWLSALSEYWISTELFLFSAIGLINCATKIVF